MNEEHTMLSKKPRCFCKVPLVDLEKWAYKKYVEGKDTLALMKETATEYDRELVTIIALLDIEPVVLNAMLGHETKPTCNLRICRERVRAWLMNIVENRTRS
jgi:hypothetical protein